MAYGVKYTCLHKVDINGTVVNYRISLRAKDYVGASTEVLGNGEFFTLNYENTSTTDFLKNPIQKGRLEFYLMIQNSTDQGIVEEIADSSEDDWQMELYADDVLQWRGWVLPDLIQFSQGDYPYACTITAKDFTILGSLEYPLDEQVVRGVGAKYGTANLRTVIQIISNLIAKSELNIDTLTTYTNWVNTDSSAADKAVDFLQTTFVRPFALRNYGNDEDGGALSNIRIGDGFSNFIENYTIADDTPLSVEESLSILLKNFGLFMRQAEGEIKIYQLSALNVPFNSIEKTTYSINSFGNPVFGFFGVNFSQRSTETITQPISSDTFLLPDSNNTYLPAYRESRITYNHRTNLDKLNLTTTDLVGYSGNQENTISSEELIYPDGTIKLFIQYDVLADFFYTTSVDLSGNMKLRAWVDAEIKIERSDGNNLYYSSELNQWTTDQVSIKLPFQTPERITRKGFTQGTLSFATGFRQFITEPIPSGDAGTLVVKLNSPKGLFSAFGEPYYQPNFLSGNGNLQLYTGQTGDTVFYPSIPSSYRYNDFNTRIVFDQTIDELLRVIGQKNAIAVSNNTLGCLPLTEAISIGTRVFYETVINSQTVIESSLTTTDVDEGATEIPLELVLGVPPNGGNIYLQDELSDSSATTYVLTNKEVVSSATFDYGTVVYGDGITSNSIGAIIIGNADVTHNNTNDTWNILTSTFVDSFSKWKRLSDDDEDAGSIFKLLLRESIEGRGVVVNSQLVYRPNRVIEASLYAPYFGHKLLQADGQNFFFIGGAISGNGFSSGVFMQVPNRTPQAILTNLLSQGTNGTFSSTQGAIANFSQSFANSQFVSQTTERLSGTITSIPINPIAFSIGKLGDAISVIDNASGNIEDFVIAETYKPNDLSILVVSKTLTQPLAIDSFVVYDAERVTSYITQTDEAIRLGVRSADTATTDDGFILTDENDAEYRFTDGDPDSRIDATNAEISILSNQIVLKVDANGVISAVSLTADAETGSAVTIEADNIDIVGIATFLSSDNSFISAVGNEVGVFDFTPVTVYEQTTEPTGGTYVMGDVWVDTDNGNRVSVYNGTIWVAQFTEIDGGTITTGTINSDQIATNAITADKIVAGAVDASKINVSDLISVVNSSTGDTTRISGNGIQTNSISSDNIVANAITTEKIEAGAVFANKLDVDTEGAIRLNVKSHDRALASNDDEFLFSDNSPIAFVEGDNDARSANLTSIIQAEEDRINLQVRDLGALNGFGTVPQQAFVAGDTVTFISIKPNSPTKLEAGQIIGLVGLGGLVDFYTCTADRDLSETRLFAISVEPKVSTQDISYGTGYVVIPDSQISSRILINKDGINLNATNIQGANSSIATIDARVDTIGSRIALTTDTNGNVSSINLESGLASSAISIKADQIDIVGVINAVNNDTTTTIDGDKITTGTITADQIDVDNLFAETIALTGSISGNFSAGSAGWRIDEDSAEFNDVTIRGTLDGADGTFSGSLSAVDGTFTGTLSGVDGDFSGTLIAATGTFGNVSVESQLTVNDRIIVASGGFIRGNSYQPSLVGTGSGYYLGAIGGTHQFAVGNGSSYFSYNGTSILLNDTTLQSNYTAGSAGWQIKSDGDAEFNNVTVRGVIIADVGSDVDWDYVQNVSITNAQIADATITSAKIASLDADKINATNLNAITASTGNLTVDGLLTIDSTVSNAGIDFGKFTVDKNGNMTATDANITGVINADSGNIQGMLIISGSGEIFSNRGVASGISVQSKLNSNGLDVRYVNTNSGSNFAQIIQVNNGEILFQYADTSGTNTAKIYFNGTNLIAEKTVGGSTTSTNIL